MRTEVEETRRGLMPDVERQLRRERSAFLCRNTTVWKVMSDSDCIEILLSIRVLLLSLADRGERAIGAPRWADEERCTAGEVLVDDGCHHHQTT